MEEVAAGYGVPKGEALRMNILGAIVVAEAVRSTLGPGGMDKMLVGEDDPILTDKGAVILSMIPIRHPGARMAAEVALAQDREVGDGTATAVVLLGELLKKAEGLLGDGIHPSVIARGYSLAMARGLELLSQLEIPLAAGDLERAALSMLEGKADGAEREHLASLALEAVAMAGRKENIKFEYRVGGSTMATELVKGIVIDLGKRVHPSMPRRVNGAKILLIDREFEVKKEDIKIQITDPAMLGAFGEYKKKVLRVAAEMVRRSGANVLLCQRNMDPLAMSFLAQAGILGVRDIPKDVMEALASATGAKIVSNVRAVEPRVLGSAELVEERKVAGEEMLYVLCREPKAVSILVRAGTERGALETKRRMEDLVAIIANLVRGRMVVAGAGATEVELARGLREYARTIEGKEQLAIEAYAEALEGIPRAIAQNAGFHPLDALVALRAGHARGGERIGFDARDGKTKDAYAAGIIDPAVVKRQALKSASEAAIMLLRIDDVLVAQGFVEGRMEPPVEEGQEGLEIPEETGGTFK